MRHLIVLPGNSLRNKEWGAACAQYFAPQVDSVYVQQYKHWETGEQWIDLAGEEEQLRMHVTELPASTEVYIFAKSIGTILAVNAIHHGALSSVGNAFFGMPLDHAVPGVWQGVGEPLTSLTSPTIVFHNDADPTVSYTFTRDTLAAHAPHVTFITTVGTTHDYLDFALCEPNIIALLHDD